MESSVIALSIGYFNILSTIVLAFFAICGVIFAFGERLRLNIFRGRVFLRAFCIAALAAFVAETVFFNYKSNLKYFADGEFQTTEVSPLDSTVVLTTDSVVANIFVVTDGEMVSSGLTFRNLDRRVTSVFVRPVFDKHELLDMVVSWTDEESSRGFTKRLYKGLPRENFIAIQPCGKVSELTITFSGGIFFDEISQIAVNKRIPFYFSGLRLIILSFLFFVVIILLKKEFRAKAAYYMFDYKFDPASKKQNLVYAFVVVMLILFSWLCAYTSVSNSPFDTLMNYQYNRYLVDALIDGRVSLDFGHPEKLLNAERPYDVNWLMLIRNGYKPGVDWTGDVAYYKGRFYCYYGPVAAVFLYLPYKLITGNYLSYQAGVSVFASVALVFLALLWRFLVRKYMPGSRFAFYLLGLTALFFTSHLFTGLRHPSMWLIVQVSGLAFIVAGVYLLLKSVENESINYLKLFFACLCFALVVGCRPNMVFASLLVPVVLWKRRSWKLAAFVLIPFVMVAIPLCVYNYVRFDSIFQFGHKYALGIGNGTATPLLNPLAKIHRMLVTFALYLFCVYSYSVYFPFVEPIPTDGSLVTTALGFTQIYNGGGGLINFPILFCLIYMFKKFAGKNRPETFTLLRVFLIVAAVAIAQFSFMGIMHGRYLMDCMVFIVIPSLFCAYYWANDETAFVRTPRVRLGVVYVLLAASVFVGLCLSVSWYDVSPMDYGNPVLYRYLEYSLGVIERVVY